MPIWLRKFTFNKIKDYYIKENENINKDKYIDPNQISKPNITNPNYTTKASKK